jgi:hypothetical protein
MLSSAVQVSFWQELTKMKVDVLKLDQTPVVRTPSLACLERVRRGQSDRLVLGQSITGTYCVAGGSAASSGGEIAPSRLSVSADSFVRPGAPSQPR